MLDSLERRWKLSAECRSVKLLSTLVAQGRSPAAEGLTSQVSELEQVLRVCQLPFAVYETA